MYGFDDDFNNSSDDIPELSSEVNVELDDLLAAVGQDIIRDSKNTADNEKKTDENKNENKVENKIDKKVVIKKEVFDDKQANGSISIKNGSVVEFNWYGKTYHGLDGIAEALATSWDISKRAVVRGTIANWISKYRADIANRITDIAGIKNEKYNEKGEFDFDNDTSSDVGLFRVIVTIHGDPQKFYWRGKVYNSLVDFANSLENASPLRDESFVEFLHTGTLSWYLKQCNVYDSQPDYVLEMVKRIEQVARNKPYEAYYMFINGYKNSESERYFMLSGKKITSLDDILTAMYESTDPEGLVRDSIFKSPECYGFMWYWGMEVDLNRAVNNIMESPTEDCLRQMCKLLEARMPEPYKARDFVISKGEYSHINWLRDNLGNYEYLSDRAKNIANDLYALNITNNMTVDEIFDETEKYQKRYKEFSTICYKNPFELAGKIATDDYVTDQYEITKKPTGEFKYTVSINKLKAEILPKNIEAAFTHSDQENFYPFGYAKDHPVAKYILYNTYKKYAENKLTAFSNERNDFVELKRDALDSDFDNNDHKNLVPKMIGWFLYILLFGAVDIYFMFGSFNNIFGLIGLGVIAFPVYMLISCVINLTKNNQVEIKRAGYEIMTNDWKSEVEDINNLFSDMVNYYKKIDVARFKNGQDVLFTDCNMRSRNYKEYKDREDYKIIKKSKLNDSPAKNGFFYITEILLASIVVFALFSKFFFNILEKIPVYENHVNLIFILFIIGTIIATIYIMLGNADDLNHGSVFWSLAAVLLTLIIGAIILLVFALIIGVLAWFKEHIVGVIVTVVVILVLIGIGSASD